MESPLYNAPTLRSQLRYYRSSAGPDALAPQRSAAPHRRIAPAREEMHSQLVIANRLSQPSYVSFRTALEWYSILPPGNAREVWSATAIGASQHRERAGCIYHFIRLPKAYFSVGQAELPDDPHGLYKIASPEKALCDLLLAQPNLPCGSKEKARDYLLHELHADESKLALLSTDHFHRCLMAAHKKQHHLFHVEEYLRTLSRESS